MHQQLVPATVRFRLIPSGYHVLVEDSNGASVREAICGNSRRESTTFLPAEHPGALPQDVLIEFAKRTATELAVTYGLTADDVYHDEDSQDERDDILVSASHQLTWSGRHG